MASEIQKALFARTLSHPVLKPHICWGDADFLLSIAEPYPSATTDLGFWGADEASQRVGVGDLFDHMLTYGMRDPLIVSIGLETGRIRLETGNHRIRAFLASQIKWVPVVGFISSSHIIHEGNGRHEGLPVDLHQFEQERLLMGPYLERRYVNLKTIDLSVYAHHFQELRRRSERESA
jgi:hypothetical protein